MPSPEALAQAEPTAGAVAACASLAKYISLELAHTGSFDAITELIDRLAVQPAINELRLRIAELEGHQSINMEMATEIRRLCEENERLKRLEAEAWGIRFCCNEQDCGCQGKPIDPPSWWEPHIAEVNARLTADLEAARADKQLAFDAVSAAERGETEALDDLAATAARVRDEVERECVQLGCPDCSRGDWPYRQHYTRSVLTNDMKTYWTHRQGDVTCHQWRLWERRYQRAQQEVEDESKV